MAHTQGPWEVIGGTVIVSKEDRYYIAHTPEVEQKRFYETRANARLIAAAPEMIKELENCMQDFNNLAMQFPPDSDSREIAGNCASRIAELVKKARGG